MGTNANLHREAAKTAEEPCYRLIYRSRSLLGANGAEASSAEEGLADILRAARAKNADKGITGALMLYDDWFAQVLEGPKQAVDSLFSTIKTDPRHEAVTLDRIDADATRLFGNWAMAVVAEHHEPDMPMVATTGGLAQGAPWRVTPDQEAVLTRLRDLTRGYGRGS